MFEVRPEEPGDFAAVRVVHERAFEPSEEEADLVDALRATGAHVPELCLVATRDGAVVGQIAFSAARLESGHSVLALAPMGVLPDHQRQGAGSLLVAEGLRRAEQTDFALVAVVGHAGYYPRFGFELAHEHGLRTPFPVQPEAWMAYRLPAYTAEARGTLIYPEAFGDLS